MKKFKILACALAITGFGLTSCSNDDDNAVNEEAQIAGTYNLTEVRTAEPTDFNDDGTFNANQMRESDCYNDSKLILNADNTFTYHKNRIIVNTADGTSGCTEGTFTGTWTILDGSGSDAVIAATYEDNNGDETTLNLVKTGVEIIQTDLFGTYPDRNDEGGAITTFGEVEYVYRK